MWKSLVAVKKGLTKLLEQIVVLVVAALVLDVLWGVFTRFILSEPSGWTEEVATFLLIWVAMLGAAVTFGRNEHLGLDYFVNKLDPEAARWVAVLAQLATIVLATSAMVFGGFFLVSNTLSNGQISPALGIQKGYVYLAVPISGVFINIFCIERIVALVTRAEDLESSEVDASGVAADISNGRMGEQ